MYEYNPERVRNIDNTDELIAAINALFSSELNASEGMIFEQRIVLKQVAKELGCYEEASGLIGYYADALNKRLTASSNGITEDDQDLFELCRSKCKLNRYGIIESTVGNYLTIMENDPLFSTLRKNEFTIRPEFSDNDGKPHNWDDAHDAEGRGRIEDVYGIYNAKKYDDAFERFLLRHRYHPIKEVLEKIKWDGETRIPNLLSRWMGVEDNEYTREVSRLIFAGGIHRLYNPGCKFDDMPVLIGGQGAGKSTFVRWLALEDRFYKELTTTDDKKGGELVEGSWVMEVSELLALTKTKEQEEVKAFLTRQEDRFRAAYGKFVGERPRTCIFIGTSNREQFITDKTGGRRFYPVHCKSIGYDLFDHEEECREYIAQCWAEALAKIKTDYMAPYAKREIKPLIQAAQEGAMEEDYRIGMIQNWLDKHAPDAVCGGMVWEEALKQDLSRFTKADQTQIGLIMNNNIEGWKRCKPGQMKSFARYGRQRYWLRATSGNNNPTYSTPSDFTPF